MRAELMSMKFKVARADRARSVLAGSSFDNCPQCGQSVDSHRAPHGSCYLCLQIVAQSEHDINPASIASDLEARLSDIEQALRRHAGSRAVLTTEVGDGFVIWRQARRLCGDLGTLLGARARF